MTRAVNDATLQKAGDIYQYLIALRDCFELNDGDTLQIETNGDVSIINDVGGRFQREVKHHFGNTSISDRDIDFWKTLANWYVDYERVKNFSNYILSTTATIKSDSPFHSWNNIKKTEKLKCLKDIGATSKKTEETFRNQYNRIFGDSYDESRLLEILDKFTIEAAKTSIDGISNEFSKYVGHIPSENRDGYIGALLGEILIKVKEPPHKWEVTKSAFDEILQIQSAAYGTKGTAPLPNEYAKAVVPKDKITTIAIDIHYFKCKKNDIYNKLVGKCGMTIEKINSMLLPINVDPSRALIYYMGYYYFYTYVNQRKKKDKISIICKDIVNNPMIAFDN